LYCGFSTMSWHNATDAIIPIAIVASIIFFIVNPF
jgi:hypothetical protein